MLFCHQKAETASAIPVGRCEIALVSSPDEFRHTVPGTTPTYTGPAGSRACRIISGAVLIIRAAVPVGHPFPYIDGHVIDA